MNVTRKVACFTMRLDQDVWDEVGSLARERNKQESKTQLLRNAIGDYLMVHKVLKLRGEKS
jgi:predicted transcriptional regulator